MKAAATAPPPWLEGAIQALGRAHRSDHLCHALLIHQAPGTGGDWLAAWSARLVLCSQAERAPCGECAACRRVDRDEHPDLISVRPTDASTQIRIEQVRELSEALALTSHQGGYKVGVISPADALNRYAANALLKTLEEPPPRTLLILTATQPSRLPATLLSRCQRVRIAAPSREQAVEWLETQHGQADWAAVLDIVGEAPLTAAGLDAETVTRLATEVYRALDAAAGGGMEAVATAERWTRSELPLRLRCFETWLTKRIRDAGEAGPLLTEVGAGPYSRAPRTVLNTRALFGLLDGVRELRSSLETPLNPTLALEGLLRRLAAGNSDTAPGGAR